MFLQQDTCLIPITANDYYKTDSSEKDDKSPGNVTSSGSTVNDIRNQLLSKQLAGNQQIIQKMLSQVDEGARKQFWLQFEHTKYTDENK